MAGDKPVAIFNRNQLDGYFVPASAVNKVEMRQASTESVKAALLKRKKSLEPTLDYLKDK